MLPLFILAISLEYFLQNIPNVYSYKKDYLNKYSKEIQILILGNSHTYLGIDPIYFTQNTFNAGYVNQSLYYDFEILNKHKENLDELKIIVIPISYFSLWFSLLESEEYRRVKNYVIYHGLKANSIKDYSELLNSNFSYNMKRLSYYIRPKEEIECTKL